MRDACALNVTLARPELTGLTSRKRTNARPEISEFLGQSLGYDQEDLRRRRSLSENNFRYQRGKSIAMEDGNELVATHLAATPRNAALRAATPRNAPPRHASHRPATQHYAPQRHASQRN
jgi:hypothetical protein